MKCLRLSRVVLLSGALALSASTAALDVSAAGGGTGITELTRKLRSNDFRMQVQAALILGKSGDARALPALTASLKDKSVAVRAASAAALGTLGDPAALSALRRAKDDKNSAVRRRVAATIFALETQQHRQKSERREAEVLVKIEGFNSLVSGDTSAALGAAVQASRKAIKKMPSLALLNASERPEAASKRHKRPVVVVRASLKTLSTKNIGSETQVTANIEFIVERFPQRSIMGRISGNASIRAEADSLRARVKLQEEVVSAAVDSALRRSEKALLAAAGHS